MEKERAELQGFHPGAVLMQPSGEVAEGAAHPQIFFFGVHVICGARSENWGTDAWGGGGSWRTLVIIRAAKVVAAMGADEFAMVAGEPMAAGRTDLAVVVDGSRGGVGAGRTTL